MTNETNRYAALPEPRFPDDFARCVITRARFEKRRQLVRRRVIAAAVVVIAILPLARPWNLITNSAARSRDRAVAQARDNAAPLEQFTEALALTPPDQLGDYLMPNVAPLRAFATAYSDASWNYDPSWTSDH